MSDSILSRTNARTNCAPIQIHFCASQKTALKPRENLGLRPLELLRELLRLHA